MDELNDVMQSMASKKVLDIYEEEELIWLVSLLFTNEFYDKNSRYFPYMDNQKRNEYFSAIASRVNDDAEAKKVLGKILSELVYDEGETKPEQPEMAKVNSLGFFRWAESQGQVIPKEVVKSLEVWIHKEIYKKQAIETENFQFPKLEKGEFELLLKEPLWSFDKAILYVFGRKTVLNKDKILSFIKSKPEMLKLAEYIKSADKIKKLAIIWPGRFPDEHHARMENQPGEYLIIEKAEVEPQAFIEWAKFLPINLYQELQPEKPSISKKSEYITPDMQLMFDAVEKFWKGYNLQAPNPSVAPYKKEVVAWLIEQAEQRNIHGFSKTRADLIDTIIRCPVARMGGNTK